MATYEKGFMDRESSKLKKKVIDVTKQTIYSNGLMELEADVTRGDSEDYVKVGTRLNAAEMNKAILDLVYNDLFGIKLSADLHNIKIVANKQFSFEIISNERPVFANCVCNNGIDFEGSTEFTGDGSKTSITMIPDTTVFTSKSEFNFKIELYTDTQRKNYLTSVTGHVQYSPNSQSSND